MNIFKNKEVKNKVGRPKLAGEQLIKETKIMLGLALTLLFVFIITGISVVTNSSISTLYSSSLNKLSASIDGQQQDKFVTKLEGNKLTIIPPLNAKYYSVRIFKSVNGGAYIYQGVYNKINTNSSAFEHSLISERDAMFKIYLRWTSTYAGLTYKSLNINSWMPEGYIEEKYLGITWASKEYSVKGTESISTTTTKAVSEKVVCPNITYTVSGDVATINVDAKSSYKWDWYASTSYKNDIFYDFKKVSSDNVGPKVLTLKLNSAVNNKGKVVVKPSKGRDLSCLTSAITVEGGRVTTTKATTTRTTRTTTIRTTTTKVTTTKKDNDGGLFSFVRCPKLSYKTTDNAVIVTISPRKSTDNWTFYENSDGNTGSKGVWSPNGQNINGSLERTMYITNFKRQGKIVVTSEKGKTKTCYTRTYSPKKPTTTKKPTTPRVTTTRKTSDRVTINVTGTETQKVGYTADGIIARTVPSSSTVTWSSSDTSVAIVEVKDNKSIKLTLVGEGKATITATTNNGSKASFTMVSEYDSKSRPDNIALLGIDTTQQTTINGSTVYVEKGCSSGVVNNYKRLMNGFPNHLNKFANVYFLKTSSIKSSCNGTSYGCTHSALRSSLRVSCESYSPQIIVHEAAHAMDFYYKLKLNKGLISEKYEVINSWKKYADIFNGGRGRAYLRYYAYGVKSGSGYALHKNAMEFFAEAYTVYYKYRVDNSVPYQWGYDTTLPSDIESAIKPYIDVLQGL